MEAVAEITTKAKNAPALRFPEFAGEWRVGSLGDNARISSGGTPNRAKPSYWSGDIPWITTSLIDFNTILNSEEYITEEGVANSSAKRFPVGTILMAMYGQGKTRGKVAVLGIEATTNQACAAIIAKDSVDIDFLYQSLAGRYDEIRNLSNEGGQQNLSAGIIKTIKITLPSLSEQQKIASFLSAGDKKIQQLCQKKELLVKYKKGVMQQLFSQQIRFKDDNGNDFPEWEEKRLGEVAVSISNGVSMDQNQSQVGYKVTRIETISSGEIDLSRVGYVDTEQDISKYKLAVGDLLFSNINSVTHIGKIAFVYDDLDLYHGMNLLRISIDQTKHYPLFHYYQLTSKKLKQHFERVCNQAVSQASINQTDLKKTKLFAPPLNEQIKIANFLTSIDDKINYTSKQLGQAQQFKKGLLQQLFV